MYAEISNNVIVQVVDDDAPITLGDGGDAIQYPGNWDKASLGLIKVVEPSYPDPAEYIVTGSTVELVDGVPTLVYQTTSATATSTTTAATSATLADAKTAQIAALTASCRATILTALADSSITDITSYRTACFAQLETLTAEVNAITDDSAAGIAAVQAIVWAAPAMTTSTGT